MNCKEPAGFRLSRSAHGVEVEFVMPRELEGKFFARLYARGPLNDEAEGDPARVWASLAPEYEGRPLVAPHQVHGVKIIEASKCETLPLRSEADGVFIREGDYALASLRFADCAPVVAAHAGEESWMAVLHSGFKGTLQNISAAALERFGGTRGSGKTWAWIGPCIGPCCYSRREDDPATREALAKFSPDSVRLGREIDLYNFAAACHGGVTDAPLSQNESAGADGAAVRAAMPGAEKRRHDAAYFDIGAEIRRQLAGFGVPEENIFSFGGCTRCGNGLFYSYRAGDKEKRNFLLAGRSTIRENM